VSIGSAGLVTWDELVGKLFVALNPLAAIVIAIATVATACQTQYSAPSGVTGVVNVPVKVVTATGDVIRAVDNPAKPSVVWGIIPGAIAGLPDYSLQTQEVDSTSTFPVDFSELRKIFNRRSTTITPDATRAGLKIDPVDTRFARVATGLGMDNTSEPLGFGFIDAVSKKPLTLAFFDRPCRLSGIVKEHEMTILFFDVVVHAAGLTWMQMTADGADHVSVTNAPGRPTPILVVAPIPWFRKLLTNAPTPIPGHR
jgi:hypothetical protein